DVDRFEGEASDVSDHPGADNPYASPADTGTVATADAHQPSDDNPVRPPIIERVIRPQDADPRRANRSERAIALMFLLSAAGTVGFIVAYLAIPTLATTKDDRWSNFWLGISLTVSLGG